jgi:predicted membrane protein
MISISIGMSLIALSTGMFLLAKTNRDSLSLFFKIISYFIIVASFLNIGCAIIYGGIHSIYKHYHHQMKMNSHFMGNNWKHEMNKNNCNEENCLMKDDRNFIMKEKSSKEDAVDSCLNKLKKN